MRISSRIGTMYRPTIRYVTLLQALGTDSSGFSASAAVRPTISVPWNVTSTTTIEVITIPIPLGNSCSPKLISAFPKFTVAPRNPSLPQRPTQIPKASIMNKIMTHTFVIARPDSIFAKISTAQRLIIVSASRAPTANATYAVALFAPVSD